MRAVSIGCVIAVAALLLASAPAGAAVSWVPNSVRVVDKPAGEFYTYAPSAIQDGHTLRVWSCHNQNSGVVRDHVFYTERDARGVRVSKSVLGPGAPGSWDAFHVCDPSVIGGRFRFEGVSYRYAMFYLGNPVDASADNQVGVAFANDLAGDWTRYPAPLVTHTADGSWGAGQPSAVSLDGKGQVLLFFTNGDATGTYGLWETLDLSDMASPVLGSPHRVPTAGLIGADGKQDVLNDFDVAYAPARDRYYIVRDQHPNPTDNPSWISSTVQVDSISRQGLLGGGGTWTVEGDVGPALTGFPRNHDAGLVRTLSGQLPDPHAVTVVFATSCAGTGCNGVAPLWTYGLERVTGHLSDG